MASVCFLMKPRTAVAFPLLIYTWQVYKWLVCVRVCGKYQWIRQVAKYTGRANADQNLMFSPNKGCPHTRLQADTTGYTAAFVGHFYSADVGNDLQQFPAKCSVANRHPYVHSPPQIAQSVLRTRSSLCDHTRIQTAPVHPHTTANM